MATSQGGIGAIARRHILRIMFGLSLPLALFWIIGIVWDVRFGWDPNPLALLASCAALTAVLGSAILQRQPDVLALPNSVRWGEIIERFVADAFVAYLCFIVVLAISGVVLVATGVLTGRDATEFVVILSLWLPLWLIVPSSCVVTWRRLRESNERAI
jgi:hypothetical protein